MKQTGAVHDEPIESVRNYLVAMPFLGAAHWAQIRARRASERVRRELLSRHVCLDLTCSRWVMAVETGSTKTCVEWLEVDYRGEIASICMWRGRRQLTLGRKA